MPVLPELHPMVSRIAQARQFPADPAQSVADRRAAIHRGMDQRAATVTLPAPALVTHRDHTITADDGGSIDLRSYHPGGEPAGDEQPRPGHVYVHGGGWWLGTLDHRDALLARRAVSTGSVVVSVAHRPAPERRYPVPAEDVYAALSWVAAHADTFQVDPGRLSIGGDSSGANLAAAAVLMARDRGGPRPAAQVLEIPVLDLTLAHAEREADPDAVVLTYDELAENIERYCDPDRRGEPYASPLLSPDLSGLPPTLIMTAEFDVLRGDGRAYAERLAAARVPVTLHEWAGHVHGSHDMTAVVASARDWQGEVDDFLRTVTATAAR
ncbi:alpha/beta hydrolase [Jiangella mangrovi]|uniref:Acetyl esterase n=1 Tax=Jiangella mangrovi TaxID=1524084 RepID=A0A7W9GUB9_9ACTN|nr:alpha/beta hydrolase [Jiangella mangrovi]MBB5790072.1 acetyl esterase [Jiangella mangrovi]